MAWSVSLHSNATLVYLSRTPSSVCWLKSNGFQKCLCWTVLCFFAQTQKTSLEYFNTVLNRLQSTCLLHQCCTLVSQFKYVPQNVVRQPVSLNVHEIGQRDTIWDNIKEGVFILSKLRWTGVVWACSVRCLVMPVQLRQFKFSLIHEQQTLTNVDFMKHILWWVIIEVKGHSRLWTVDLNWVNTANKPAAYVQLSVNTQQESGQITQLYIT